MCIRRRQGCSAAPSPSIKRPASREASQPARAWRCRPSNSVAGHAAESERGGEGAANARAPHMLRLRDGSATGSHRRGVCDGPGGRRQTAVGYRGQVLRADSREGPLEQTRCWRRAVGEPRWLPPGARPSTTAWARSRNLAPPLPSGCLLAARTQRQRGRISHRCCVCQHQRLQAQQTPASPPLRAPRPQHRRLPQGCSSLRSLCNPDQPAHPAGSSVVLHLSRCSPRRAHWLAPALAVLCRGSRRVIRHRRARQKKAICLLQHSLLTHALDPPVSAGPYPSPGL
ncbi:hypothetical protein K505DRAFT_151833 [Melanomma pulvis-pyrius CBS 109.77]|uniref:Uncharacterized protein n=1 Tax=Melanomma pulvis-pyrius CBS 109.77 TaxID=1314802 RepID=A0A6A6XY81_9PLEO|nr:hypothetical protein K505DRAFT_151833 [Melanomma pulvis-pyrius CBS 109.77]